MPRLLLYIGTLLASLMAIVGLLVLPPLGIGNIESLFTLIWLIFACLIAGSFLQELYRRERVQHQNRLKTRKSGINKVKELQAAWRKGRGERARG